MGGLERAMECLRPLVENKTWDYCIVWRLGDDPSRFIEWMDCCCGGAYGLTNTNVKVEREEVRQLSSLCRDTHSEHPVRTRACEALALFPSFMPLYSGIHGEVVVSAQPRWLFHGTALDSNLSHELVGTQVLIPVVGGLIELFIAKHVPKDQNIIDLVTVQCHIPLEQEVIIRSCINVSPKEDNLPPPPMLSLPPKHKSLKRPRDKSSFSTNHLDLLLAEKENEKPGSKEYQSKNLITERNRRNRIKDGLFTLRSLVPKITKMDRAAILGDAIDYIVELEEEVKKLKDELDMEQEECNRKDPELKRWSGHQSATTEHNRGSSNKRQRKQTEAQRAEVEVKLIGTREFLLKLSYEQKRGRFARLMEAINDLGLQVVDANITTVNGKVLNILRAEVYMDNERNNDLMLIGSGQLGKIGHPMENCLKVFCPFSTWAHVLKAYVILDSGFHGTSKSSPAFSYLQWLLISYHLTCHRIFFVGMEGKQGLPTEEIERYIDRSNKLKKPEST